MRILLAAKHPPGGKLPIGGVQTWIATVAAAMIKRGHEVSTWGPEFALPSGPFDLGIFANIKYTFNAQPLCQKVKRISHGVIPDECGGDGWLFTSEEVRGTYSGEIVRQPIDLEFWTPSWAKRKYLTRFSYRGGLGFIKAIADEMGLEYAHVKDCQPEKARDILRQSRCVITTGRAALEAMACGVPVVIADNREYQGPLVDFDTLGAMARNYSGRGGSVVTKELLHKAINQAIKAGCFRHHVEKYHDVRSIVGQLLC